MDLLNNFYLTPSLPPLESSKVKLTMGGGPFGYNIHYALEIDYIITNYKCDAIIETGTNSGDTTEYFANQYPNLPIITCEIEENYFNTAKNRLNKYSNVFLFKESSEQVVKKFQNTFKLPFYFLDAHWYDYWPIIDEINNINKGIISIDDFDIGVEGYNFDQYKNQKCDLSIIPKKSIKFPIYSNNPNFLSYKYPLIPSIYNAGRAFFGKNIKKDLFKFNKMFKTIWH